MIWQVLNAGVNGRIVPSRKRQTGTTSRPLSKGERREAGNQSDLPAWWPQMNKETAMKNELALNQKLGPFLTLLLWSVRRSDDMADTADFGVTNPRIAVPRFAGDVRSPRKAVRFLSLVLSSLKSSVPERVAGHTKVSSSRCLQPQSSLYWFRSEVHTA